MPDKKIVTAISKLEDFEKCLPCFLDPNKTLALLLDFDGTLAPIVPNPDKAAMPPDVDAMVKRLAKHPKIFMGVISGRGLDNVKSKVGIEGITYAGNHGIEILNIDGTRHDFQLPEELQISFKKLVKELNEKVVKNGAWVEDKKFSLTFHYREHSGAELDEQARLTKEIIEAHGFKANQAHEAIEAKPPINWNKGEAARYILEKHFGKDWPEKIRVVFAGDDTTDEDAMRILQGTGKTFRVTSDPELETYADFRLPSQENIKDLLTWICCKYS